MTKQTILLVFGGESSEHDVSIMSARNVYQAINKSTYDVELCYIPKHGNHWLHVSSFDDLTGPVLQPLLGQKTFTSHAGEVPIDVFYPVLHGKHGEDGEVQGLASLLHVPCVGPSVIGAAVTMDKDITKKLLEVAAIPVAKWRTWHVADDRPTYDDIAGQLGTTLFIKPSSGGSSVGVSKVVNEEEFESALTLAAKHDSIVLIEESIVGREIEVAVIGNFKAQATLPGEIIPGEDFYTYDAKYADDSASVAKIPADVTTELAEEISQLALSAYRATRGHGMARVDFFLTESNEIYCNEINSLPGFTNISMYPKLWEYEGVPQSVLVDRLIAAATDGYLL